MAVTEGKALKAGAAGVFERVIVPLDGTERAERVLPYVLRLARWFRSELTLLHVLLPTSGRPVGPAEVSYPDMLHDRVASLAGDYLSEVAGRIAQHGVPTKKVIVSGEVAAMILARAAHGSFNLIAMATSPPSSSMRLMGRSVTEQVWVRSKVPILVLDPRDSTPQARPPAIPGNVLIPLDGTARSHRAIPYARQLALEGGLGVTLLGVAPSRGVFTRGDRASVAGSSNGARPATSVERCLEMCAEELRNASIPVRTMFRPEKVLPAVAAVTSHIGPHMIVASACKRQGWKRRIVGTFVHRIARLTREPVILVPSDDSGAEPAHTEAEPAHTDAGE